MTKQTHKLILGPLAVPLIVATACGETTNVEGNDATSNEHIAVTKLEITSSDEPYLLHPLRVAVEAELKGDAFSTDLLIGMRSSSGQTGCVLGAMPVEHGLDDGDEAAPDAATSVYANEAQFVVDRECYELVGRDDVELFASFDPWNRLGDRVTEESTPSAAALDIYSIVAAAAVSVEGCETCETHYALHENPGLDAQLRELNLSSVVAVLPVAAEGGAEPIVPNRPDLSVTTLSRVTGLANGEALDEGRVQLVHRIRPLGSNDAGLPLIQRKRDEAGPVADVEVPSNGDLMIVSALYIEDATREAIVDGAWSNIEEFELVTCLETDFEQAIYDGESEPRENDCAAVPVVIIREEVGSDGLPLPNPGAAAATEAKVWGDTWGANAGYGFGYSGLTFETWLDVNASDGQATTYKGINVHNAGSWFEAGVFAGGEVFDNPIDVVDIYGTFIGYNFGGGGVAMGASIFVYEFIPEFEIQLADGESVSLQDVFDAANLDIETYLTLTYPLVGVSFDDGCGSVSAGLWLDGTLGIDAEQTTVTIRSTDEGVEVVGTITPFMDISANAGATVNYDDYVSGGIVATLNLLELDVPFTVGVEVIDYSPLDALRLVFNEYASATLTTLSGDIGFSINWDLGAWCLIDDWCRGDHTHTIASWDGFDTSVDFFNLTQTITIGDGAPNGTWCTNTAQQLFSGDFNGDGASDYLCHRTSDGRKWIDFQSGGSFGGTDWTRDANWCTGDDVLIGDFNGDGSDDMLCRKSTAMLIDYADQDGKFYGTDWSYSAGWCTNTELFTLKTGDYDEDGRDDLLCQRTDGLKIIDYADANGQFEFYWAGDYFGFVLPTSFCGRYDGETIALKTYHDKYVSAMSGGHNNPLGQASSVGAAERFLVACDGEDVVLKTNAGLYVRAASASNGYVMKQTTGTGTNTVYTGVEQDDGRWSFLTVYNRYVQAKDSCCGWAMNQSTGNGDWTKYDVIVQ